MYASTGRAGSRALLHIVHSDARDGPPLPGRRWARRPASSPSSSTAKDATQRQQRSQGLEMPNAWSGRRHCRAPLGTWRRRTPTRVDVGAYEGGRVSSAWLCGSMCTDLPMPKRAPATAKTEEDLLHLGKWGGRRRKPSRTMGAREQLRAGVPKNTRECEGKR